MSKNCRDNNKFEYESIGTLSYRSSSSQDSLFFIPDQSHLLEYSAGSYAVFVGPLLRGSENDREARAVRLRDDDEGIILKKSIPINVGEAKEDLLRVARLAAEKQAKVTVTVKEDGESFDLAGITLPAR